MGDGPILRKVAYFERSYKRESPNSIPFWGLERPELRIRVDAYKGRLLSFVSRWECRFAAQRGTRAGIAAGIERLKALLAKHPEASKCVRDVNEKSVKLAYARAGGSMLEGAEVRVGKHDPLRVPEFRQAYVVSVANWHVAVDAFTLDQVCAWQEDPQQIEWKKRQKDEW